jgi:hypothetical protein
VSWEVALLAATGVHLGFQVTVSTLAYPALAAVPRARWAPAHDAHSRRIVPLVVGVYAAVLVTCVGVLLEDRSWATGLAVLGNAVALGLTAVAAAPIHGRLGRGWDAALVRRLLLVDRGRTAAAAVALVGAVAAAGW